MSYELCNAFKLDKKNNVVKIKHCSNNEFPKEYYETELFTNGDYTYEEKLQHLLDCLIQGDITISSINNQTIDVVYAYEKALEKAKFNSGIDFCSDKWNNRDFYNAKLEEVARSFIDYLELAKELKGKYVIMSTTGRSWLSKLAKYNYRYGSWTGYYTTYTSTDAKVVDYKTAVLICKKFKDLTMVAYNEI